MAVSLALALALGSTPTAEPPSATAGTPIVAAPLGRRRKALQLGGGIAMIVPFYDLVFAYGLGRRLDLFARYETIVGLHHRPGVGLRWALADIGRWTLGVRTSIDCTLFGLVSDRTDLTASIRAVGGLVASGPIRGATQLVLGVDGDVQLVEWTRLRGDTEAQTGYEYAATTPRIAVQTPLTPHLVGYLAGRVRVPTDTLVLRARTFYVFPFVEIGGTFGW